MMLKERLVTSLPYTNSRSADQSKKALERMMDDKIFFYDSHKAFIMNCIDFNVPIETIHTEYEDRTNSEQQINPNIRFMSSCFNSYKIISKFEGKNPNNNTNLVKYQIFEPLSKKWNELKERLIM
mmetsp:Transcript_1361/g.1208  ORF Transcript_1361/g.1208 Transcript_1361/m.1208 type:complete len:125 (+) Transcript_1361:623-997(+)